MEIKSHASTSNFPKFRPGQKVQLKKDLLTCDVEFGWPGSYYKRNYIFTVYSCGNKTFETVEGHPSGGTRYLFNCDQFYLLEGENRVKKELTIYNVIKDGICNDILIKVIDKFQVKYGMYGTIPPNEALEFEESVNQEGWLQRNGYCEPPVYYDIYHDDYEIKITKLSHDNKDLGTVLRFIKDMKEVQVSENYKLVKVLFKGDL